MKIVKRLIALGGDALVSVAKAALWLISQGVLNLPLRAVAALKWLAAR